MAEISLRNSYNYDFVLKIYAMQDKMFTNEKDESELFRNQNKWYFLVLLCLSSLGYLYNSQAIPTLQVPLEKEMGLDELAYSRLLIAEAIPGFLFLLVGGYLVDYFGAVKSFLASSVIIVLGQIICTIAAYKYSFLLFVLGKIVLVIAGESAMLSRTKIIRMWYSNNELGRSMGSMVVMATVATIICDLAYPNLYQAKQSLGLPFLVGVIVCVASVYFSVKCVQLHQDMLNLKVTIDNESEGNKGVSYKSLMELPAIFWMIVFAVSWTMIGAALVKIYQSKFLQTEYHYTVGEAGYFLAFSQVMTAIATPLAGIIADKTQKATLSMIVSIGLIQVSTLLNISIPRCEKCLWPAVPIVVTSCAVGPLMMMAYSSVMKLMDEKVMGMVTSMVPILIGGQMVIFATVAGYIANATVDVYGYKYVFILSLVIGLCGLALSVYLHYFDLNNGKRLQHHKNSLKGLLEMKLLGKSSEKKQTDEGDREMTERV